ncbi:universal stress protein [Parasediminibacterium sp. JCM 36343]|uniref:universal stress protein n=1 Tax=Parasediminibacterium sp. JCM 36343 TaxID=3374279 RepID=UPI00397BAB99
MKTILVPADFSSTSRNAAIYAIGLAQQVGASKIVLYNGFTFPIVVTPDPLLSSIGTMEFDTIKQASQNELQHLKQSLEKDCPIGISIDTIADYGSFTSEINKICQQINADVIVMGITSGGVFYEKILGSNTTVIAKTASVPVIIVPANRSYKHIDRFLLVSDFAHVIDAKPYSQIKDILNDTKASLLILNVAETSHHSYYEDSFECLALKKIFAGHNPKFHFIVSPNFSEAINSFADENKVDVTIIIPKKHSLLENIFISSHSKELAFHSHVPLVAIHE